MATLRSPWQPDYNKETSMSPPVIDMNHVDEITGDYASIIHALNTNSTVTRIKVLDKLLTQILDTKQKLWGELSQSLRKCFVSTSNEIFTRTLKIHHRIISIPNTTCDGYLSLLKSTFLLLNSRYFTDLNKSRVSQTLHLVIVAQNVVIKSLLHASRTVIDEIVAAFVSVLTFKSVFEWFGVLDPTSKWLSNFTYGSHIRTAFFNHLKQKHTDFVKQIGDNFVKNPDESKICGNFLLQLWRYENSNLEPELRIEAILETASQKVIKLPLFTELFSQNPSLLTPKLLDILEEPLWNRNNIESHLYIFEIIVNIAKSRNFRVIFGVSGKVRRRRNNLPQKITDLTILSLEEKDVKNLPALLTCCAAIFDSHPVALIQVNPTKFLESLYEFYRLSWKSDVANRGASLALFKFFYSWYPPTLKILSCDNEVLVDLFSFNTPDDLKILINRLSCDKNGYEFLKRHQVVVKSYLEEIGDNCDYTNFILFLVTLKLTTKSVVAFLCDDEENTVVESNQSLTLADLIEKSLDCTDLTDELLGLLVMKVLIINLDLLLYLQANHQMQEKLKSFERSTIDACSSLRHNISLSIEFIGFPEKQENENILEVTELKDLPQIFELLEITSVDNEFRTFLDEGSSTGDFSWLTQARRAFKNSLDKFDVILHVVLVACQKLPSVFPLLLDKVPKTYVYRKIELTWPPMDCVYYQLHPEDFSGIALIVDFGLKTGLLHNDDDTHNDNLTLLIKQSRAFLSHQPETFTSFDWFVAVIFLICSGNYEKCKSVLINFTNTQVTSLVWYTFGREFDSMLQEKFYQHFLVVLEENSCFEALKMLRIAPDILTQSWLTQCFFNLIQFEEVFNFLVFSVLYPAECLIYYMVAIFVHLDERICTVTHSPSVENILAMSEMSDFKLSNYINMIEQLAKRYRNSHKL